MSIGENIRKIRRAYGLSQQELGKIAGVSDKAVSTWENGSKTPRMGAIQKIADHFGIKKSDIIEDSDISTASTIEGYVPKGQMPILGFVAAGIPLYAEENIEGYCANDFDDGEDYFALRVRGDSMNACGINDGDLVVVRKQSMVANGDVAVVAVNGDYATVKYFRQDGNMVVLSPKSYNEIHQTQIYNTTETPIHIIGRVMEARKKF